MKRRYFSQRSGTNPHSVGIDFNTLRSMALTLYTEFERKNYFQEHFGYDCVDAGQVPGTLGEDLNTAVLFKLRKTNIWPFHEHSGLWEEDDLFDVIEFLFDHISCPEDGFYHSYCDCGWHYKTFNQTDGQSEFRDRINEILEDYDGGYELSKEGEILRLADTGMSHLIDAKTRTSEPRVQQKIDSAISKFRRRGSSIEDRSDAVRDLADALEWLKPKVKRVLHNKDESALFELVNNFGVRHFNPKQKIEYDKPIWLSWMFYFCLSSIHASLHLIEKNSQKP